MKSAFLLTGMPGTGKTSLIKEIISVLGDRAGGFYTEEIRVEGVRQGFRLITLEGQATQLAHINIRSPFRVSKYGVDIVGLENIGVEVLERAAGQREVVVIDEIGKMELFSRKFKSVVLEIINSGKKVLGTIMLKPEPWADSLKHHPQVQLLALTRQNRQEVMAQIERWLGI